MEQQLIIKSTLEKLSLIENLPIEFRVDNRRPIKFTCPTVYDLFSELDIKVFLTVISLTADKLKEMKLTVSFDTSTPGKIIQGFMGFTDYSSIMQKYLSRYIVGAAIIDGSIHVENEKVMSYELQYIAETMQIALGQKNFEEKQEAETVKDPIMNQILEAQKAAEEKLRKAKAKKAARGKGYSVEELMLAISYEFGYSVKDLLNKTYFALIWYFGFVSKVDAHKLNQMILSSGMSKKKNYSYWLNT